MSLVNQTVQIVQAFLSRNEIEQQGVSGLIQDVHRTLVALSSGSELPAGAAKPANSEEREANQETVPPVEEKLQPAVPISQAVTNDDVVCLICGQRVKTLRGHLTRSHSMEANDYRNKFGLDKNFPLVAPSYSDRRRKLAQDSGLSEKLRAGRRKKLEAAKNAEAAVATEAVGAAEAPVVAEPATKPAKAAKAAKAAVAAE
ncbi:MAG: MucR family transcriptional regulator [Magnetococcales bacterium]|nr:MucR family transcriptional regulator [Magnetococcales bacterium]NGZ28606.1 MucR family transcriptional regulator [Magnetococcales bacterium]